MLRTLTRSSRQAPLHLLFSSSRAMSTLQSNPHIYVFPDPANPTGHLLTLLPTSPPARHFAIGTTTEVPPTPNSFRENPVFFKILHQTISQNAHLDPQLQAQAASLATSSGAMLLQPSRRQYTNSDQSREAGRGVGGWIHVSDNRNPPDFGRIAEPEDIFGSVEVDANGKFAGGTTGYQKSGTYRAVTRNGVLGLSDFMRGKVVEALRNHEQRERD